MSTRFDTNDFRDARPNAYWIERPTDYSAPTGGLIVYILSGAMLICAMQARLRILMLGIGRARVEEIMAAHVPAGATRYAYDALIRQPFVDGNWAGRTQTALLVAAVQLGAPREFITELAGNLRDSQVGWRSLKFAILVAFKFPASLMSTPAAGRAGDIAKLAESIELRYSSLPGISSTTNVLHPPSWRRETSVTSEAPRRTTVNDVLGGGITFTPGPTTTTANPPRTEPPVTTTPPAPTTTTPRPPAATPPPPRSNIATTPPAVPAPPTIARSSGAGAAVALVVLGVGAAFLASSEKKPKRLF